MSQDNRNLEPTLRRRQQARREGQVATSRQLSAAAVGLACAAMLSLAGPQGLASTKLLFVHAWTIPWSHDLAKQSEPHTGLPAWADIMGRAAALVVPFLGLILGTAIVARLLQTGLIWAPHRVLPTAGRVDPSVRLAELFHASRLRDTCVLAGLLLLGLGLTAVGLWQQRYEIVAIATAAAFEMELTTWVTRWCLRVALGLSALAAIDYGCQRYRFEQHLRMSAEEVRAEIRAIQGNPEIARARQERGRWWSPEGERDRAGERGGE